MPLPARTKGRCRTLDCPGEHVTRGLCAACFESYRRERDAGRITEEQAVAAGRLLPRHKGRRKNQAYFRSQLPIVFPAE